MASFITVFDLFEFILFSLLFLPFPPPANHYHLLVCSKPSLPYEMNPHAYFSNAAYPFWMDCPQHMINPHHFHQYQLISYLVLRIYFIFFDCYFHFENIATFISLVYWRIVVDYLDYYDFGEGNYCNYYYDKVIFLLLLVDFLNCSLISMIYLVIEEVLIYQNII